MGLLELPPELVLRVSEHLTTPELGAFRRSCKHIEATLFDSFAKEFFTKRQFMIEQVSLQALVDIANHPTLSGRLTEVIIGLDLLHTDPDYLHDTPKAVYKAGHVSRSVLLETGLARDMLVEAFSRLPNLRTVGLRDYAGAGRYRDGPNVQWKSYGWSFGIPDLSRQSSPHNDILRAIQASPESTFPLLLYALGQAHARPTSIEVFLRRYSKLTPNSLNIINGLMASTVLPVLAGLKKLMLSVALSNGPAYSAPSYPMTSDSMTDIPLKRLLHHTPDLQTLRINFDPRQFLAHNFLLWLGRPASSSVPAANSANGPISPVALTGLTSLDLGMLTVPGPVLVKAIAKFNLRSLNLWKVTLQCKDYDEFEEIPDRWSHFFLSLSNGLPTSTSIRSMMVGYMYQSDYSADIMTGLSHSVRVRFTPEGHHGDQRPKTFLDTVSYRAAYGASIKDWLGSLADRTSRDRPIPVDSESESDDEDDGDDEVDGSDDGDEDDVEGANVEDEEA